MSFPITVRQQLSYGAPSHAEIQQRKQAQRLQLDAGYVVRVASVAYNERTRDAQTFGYFLFNAFADYTEGWDSGRKDRLWKLCVASGRSALADCR